MQMVLQFKQAEQKIDTLLINEKYLAIRKYLAPGELTGFLNCDWLFYEL